LATLATHQSAWARGAKVADSTPKAKREATGRELAVRRLEPVDRGDVRVVEGREQVGLALEAPEPFASASAANADHDLSPSVSLFDVAQSVPHLRQSEAPLDHGCHLAGGSVRVEP